MTDETQGVDGQCDLCGIQKADVETIGEAEGSPLMRACRACPPCRWYWTTIDELGDSEACLACGADGGDYVELETAVGVEGVPAFVSGLLCDDCSSGLINQLLDIMVQRMPSEAVDHAEGST